MRWVRAGLGLVLVLASCQSSAAEIEGFDSVEECLRAVPAVRRNIGAEDLGRRCGVSEEMALIALDAAAGRSSEPEETASGPSGVGPDPVPETVATTDVATTAPSTTSAPSTSAATTTTVPADWVEVPDVVGLDHQLAQDTMQFAGLRKLSEEDASGDGRRLIWDRNWIVVAQDPPAGSVVDPDTEVLLSSLKDDEIE